MGRDACLLRALRRAHGQAGYLRVVVLAAREGSFSFSGRKAVREMGFFAVLVVVARKGEGRLWGGKGLVWFGLVGDGAEVWWWVFMIRRGRFLFLF